MDNPGLTELYGFIFSDHDSMEYTDLYQMWV